MISGKRLSNSMRRHPQIRLSLLELTVDRVAASVESGEADLGLLPDFRTEPTSPWLKFDTAYELDLVLVTPADHPLARKRVVQPADLLGYPLINAERSRQIPDPAISAALEKLGVFQTQGASSRSWLLLGHPAVRHDGIRDRLGCCVAKSSSARWPSRAVDESILRANRHETCPEEKRNTTNANAIICRYTLR